jgi:hypothetical protein
MYIHIYMYIYAYMYIYILIHTSIYIHIFIYTNTFIDTSYIKYEYTSNSVLTVISFGEIFPIKYL